MVQILPGWGEQLAPAIGQIGDAVQKFINPNREFQDGMKRALATNPQLMQQLADIEASAPGSLQRLGFGPLGEAIRAVPESAESEYNRKNKEQIATLKTTGLDIDTAEGKLKLRDLQRVADTIAKYTDRSSASVFKEMTQTPNEIRMEALQLKSAETRTEVDAAQAPAEIKKAARDLKIETTFADVPDLGKIDLYDLAKRYRTGKLDDFSIIASIYRTPGISQAFEGIKDKMDRDDALIAQREMYNMREGGSDADRLDSYYLQRAAQQYEDSGNTGSIMAWKRYLSMPIGERAGLDAMSKNDPSKLSLEYRELTEVHRASKAIAVDQKLAGNVKFARDFGTLYSRAVNVAETTRDPSENNPVISEMLSQMNDLLASRGVETGRNVQAKFGKIPGSDSGVMKFKKDTGIYFEDANGEVVDPNEITIVPTTRSTQAEQEFALTISNLEKLSAGERAARLQELKGLDEDQYKAAVAYFAKKKVK